MGLEFFKAVTGVGVLEDWMAGVGLGELGLGSGQDAWQGWGCWTVC